ncbi:MAG: AAA family ATPase [Rhodocyclaceae bacterium]|nr:AAA family ATPase [Rhodocyclaceae bacterium]
MARRRIFAPDARKKPPTLTSTQLANACKISPSTVTKARQAKTSRLPMGQAAGGHVRFTVDEVRAWARHYDACHRRLPSQRGVKLVVANFKGGVSKTTTTAHLAQGLSMRGYDVLLIDLDAQGSLTSTFGISPEFEVEASDTVVPITSGESASLCGSIRPTYWPGIDIIPGSVALNGADFFLPARQARDPRFSFWGVLDAALQRDGLLYRYDYIIIDTPPAISYLTINAFWCANALLVPMPPEGPDFVSSSQFWSLFAQMAAGIEQRVLAQQGQPKRYDWIRVLPTKVDHQRPHTEVVLDWMRSAYRDIVLPIEIPMTSAVSVGGVQMGTVYDIEHYSGSSRTYLRARQTYDALVTEVDRLTRQHCWNAKE